jgi:hypothetical protein
VRPTRTEPKVETCVCLSHVVCSVGIDGLHHTGCEGEALADGLRVGLAGGYPSWPKFLAEIQRSDAK